MKIGISVGCSGLLWWHQLVHAWKKWAAWEVGVEVKVHVSLGRRVCCGVSLVRRVQRFGESSFICREYFATIFSVIFNNGAVRVCSPPLGSPLIQWLFAPGRAGVGTEHPEPRFFWISTWKPAYCLQLPALFMEAFFHLIAIVLDQSFGHALHCPVAQMCWEGKSQGRMMSSHSPSADSGPGLVRWWSSSYNWASS